MALDNPGGIIILELNINDYNLTEIAHIIESNNAHILNLFVVTNNESTKLEVNIKLNVCQISHSSFRLTTVACIYRSLSPHTLLYIGSLRH